MLQICGIFRTACSSGSLLVNNEEKSNNRTPPSILRKTKKGSGSTGSKKVDFNSQTRARHTKPFPSEGCPENPSQFPMIEGGNDPDTSIIDILTLSSSLLEYDEEKKRNSTNSEKHLSDKSIVDELRDNGPQELKNIQTHEKINEEIAQSIQSKIDSIVISIFPEDSRSQKFSKHMIHNLFYNNKIINITKTRELENEAEIRRVRNEQLQHAHDATDAWLKRVSLSNLVLKWRNDIKEYYIENTFPALLFEEYLFAMTIKAENSCLAENEEDMHFTVTGDPQGRIDLLYSDFAKKLEIIYKVSFQSYQPYSFSALLFEQYLATNPDNFIAFDMSRPDMDDIFSSSIVILKEKFNTLLKSIINTLCLSTPLWQTCYLLWFDRKELFIAPNLEKMVLEKYRELYIESNKNNGQNGIALRQKLLGALPKDLSSIYFKEDSKTHQKTFKSRKDLENIVSSHKYNPLRGHSSFYREAKEALEILPKKEEKTITL